MGRRRRRRREQLACTPKRRLVRLELSGSGRLIRGSPAEVDKHRHTCGPTDTQNVREKPMQK